MKNKMSSFFETFLKWDYAFKSWWHRYFSTEPSILKCLYRYDTFVAVFLEHNRSVCYEQWLPVHTKVPLIQVQKVTDEQRDLELQFIQPVTTRIENPLEVNECSQYVIAANNAFFKVLSDEMQEALIEHELAHIVHGDVDSIVDDSFDIAKELLADFAVAMQGKGKALVEALLCINNLIPDVVWRRKAKKILEFRITYLQKHSIPQYEDQLKAQEDIKEFMESVEAM